MTDTNPAQKLAQRLDALRRISDEPGRLTRTFCSPAMRRANDLVASWMREAGMTVREDAIGNLIGNYRGSLPDAKVLLLGSHLDTVRDAGRFDGIFGVLVAIAAVEYLHENKTVLPFAIEVIGFADEEGVRYQSAYLGSRAVTGAFNREDLKRVDASGIAMAEAIRNFGGNPDALDSCRFDPKRLVGYVEVHIEQGPVLEAKNLAVGVVTGIAGQTRARFTFSGAAGHAGTVPTALRQDALCGAAEFILAVESYAKNLEGLRATVGEITAFPGASNVIPGQSRLTLDLRHPDDSTREKAYRDLCKHAHVIAHSRRLKVEAQVIQESPAVGCNPKLTSILQQAIQRHQHEVITLPSGAGHDAVPLAAITAVAMLFVRCKAGISHHPDEFVSLEDMDVALNVLNDFLLRTKLL